MENGGYDTSGYGSTSGLRCTADISEIPFDRKV
jgi:hypothetical protein